MTKFRIFIGVILMLWMGSCTKETTPPGAASLTVINAVVGNDLLQPNFRGTLPIHYATGNFVAYGFFLPTSNIYTVPAGRCPLGFFVLPDTLASSKPMFLFDLDLPAASIHTLFLTGTTDAPESLLVKDEPPYYAAADSTMGIRFINLSPGSTPISVNIRDKDPGSEVADLGYKELTDFQRYAVKKGVKDYVFEFRLSGGKIIRYTARGIGNTGATVNTWLYRNFTLALIGKPDGTGLDAPRVLLISHSAR